MYIIVEKREKYRGERDRDWKKKSTGAEMEHCEFLIGYHSFILNSSIYQCSLWIAFFT